MTKHELHYTFRSARDKRRTEALHEYAEEMFKVALGVDWAIGRYHEATARDFDQRPFSADTKHSRARTRATYKLVRDVIEATKRPEFFAAILRSFRSTE